MSIIIILIIGVFKTIIRSFKNYLWYNNEKMQQNQYKVFTKGINLFNYQKIDKSIQTYKKKKYLFFLTLQDLRVLQKKRQDNNNINLDKNTFTIQMTIIKKEIKKNKKELQKKFN